MNFEMIPKIGRPRKVLESRDPLAPIVNRQKLSGCARTRLCRLRKKLADQGGNVICHAEPSASTKEAPTEESTWDMEQKFLDYIPLSLLDLDQKYPLFPV
jgi:hypothetical protein